MEGKKVSSCDEVLKIYAAFNDFSMHHTEAVVTVIMLSITPHVLIYLRQLGVSTYEQLPPISFPNVVATNLISYFMSLFDSIYGTSHNICHSLLPYISLSMMLPRPIHGVPNARIFSFFMAE